MFFSMLPRKPVLQLTITDFLTRNSYHDFETVVFLRQKQAGRLSFLWGEAGMMRS